MKETLIDALGSGRTSLGIKLISDFHSATSEDLPRGSGVSGEFGPQGFNTLMTQFTKMMENMAVLTGASAGDHASAEKNRPVNNLPPPHKDGEDIAKYICKLEADLRDIGVLPRSMSSLETFVYLKGLTDSISMVTDSKEDMLLFIACAVFCASRPLHQRGVMDSREVNSFKDLNKLALTLQTSNSDRSHAGRS